MGDKVFADLALTSGVVYSADNRDTIYEAVAIKGNRIIFVGSDAEVANYINKNTKVIDLQGKMVIPGLIDTHIHPPGLSLSELYEVQLFGIRSLEGYIEAVKKYIDQHPNATAVYGRGWLWSAFTGDELTKGPRKEHLDAIAPDIPVALRAMDGHSLWVNSKALEVNGITCETEVPAGVVIEKDAVSGELWGTLKEGAMSLAAQPQYSLDQYTDAMNAFQKKMHSFGITGTLCITGQYIKIILQACDQLEKRGELALRIRCATTVNPQDDLSRQFAAINELRQQYDSPLLRVTTAKFFADGVVEGGTACLLKPYTLAAGKGPNYYGDFLWDMEEIKQAFCVANSLGLQIHVHSIGDAATRNILDALEYVQSKAPPGDYRNTITHLQLVGKTDIPRFKELNVIACVQPYWHFKSPHWWQDVDYRILGERAEEEYPLGTFFANGVTVTSSSDHPITRVPYPLTGIDIGVTRNIDNGSSYEIEDITDMDDDLCLLNKKERATIRQMIKSFTINGAYTMFIDHETGSIEAGKLADLAVLDQNLLTINPVDIDKVKVVMTFFDGKLVYENTDKSQAVQKQA
ncbi:MAG TPA: amidohydrolase [Methylomusa anaerophila]|uniref:N-substituted formamide deformylase n=1 Tax=Methylomusa anaerophila TaxID=1930071 RepID=A0A348AEJ2_9FIRM|nr:amidohydrolase [Methylomusa anaerophila]BBB89490.1 N-substituted formamide deformylase precursor [Methylomusa anaerophila]HML89721.1 amidohydrolase [Methylomusa anaerophila]